MKRLVALLLLAYSVQPIKSDENSPSEATQHSRKSQQTTYSEHAPIHISMSLKHQDRYGPLTSKQREDIFLQAAWCTAEANKYTAQATMLLTKLLQGLQAKAPRSSHRKRSSRKDLPPSSPSHPISPAYAQLPNGTPVAARPLGSGNHLPSFRRSSTQHNGQHSVTPPSQFRKKQPARPLQDPPRNVYYTHG